MRARRSAFAAFAALAAILFTQVAIAAAAWESAPSHCQMPEQTANVCYEHCANNDLTLDLPRIKLPVAVAARIMVVPPVLRPQVVTLRVAVLPAGPPPRVLFQSFLI